MRSKNEPENLARGVCAPARGPPRPIPNSPPYNARGITCPVRWPKRAVFFFGYVSGPHALPVMKDAAERAGILVWIKPDWLHSTGISTPRYVRGTGEHVGAKYRRTLAGRPSPGCESISVTPECRHGQVRVIAPASRRRPERLHSKEGGISGRSRFPFAYTNRNDRNYCFPTSCTPSSRRITRHRTGR